MSTNAIEQKRHSKSILVGQLSNALMKPMSDESKRAISLLEDEIKNLDSDISSLLKIEQLRADPSFAAPKPTLLTQSEVRQAVSEGLTIQTASASANTTEARAKVNAAWRAYLRGNETPEQRDVLTSAGSGNGLVPQSFDSAFVSALKFFGPIATLVKQVRESDGRPTKLVISDDTASTMTYIAEDGSTSGVEADPTLNSQIPGTDSLVTVVKYSLQELDDAFNLESFIADLAGIRVARAVEYALTLGKDNGTATALPNSPTGGLLGNVTQGAVTTSLSAGISYSSLVALAGSVGHSYYVNGAFMASPSVFVYLLTQVDSTGRPFYKIDPSTGLMQIAGKPLYVNSAMPTYNAASSPVVLFGDFSRAYAYLNGGGLRIQVLRERYADVLEGASVICQRLGAQTLVSGAVKSLVTAAS